MRFTKHVAFGAGFGMEADPGETLPLREAGEIWAPSDWSIDWHSNAGWEVYLQLTGRSRWDVYGGETFDLEPQGAYLVQPGVRHRLGTLREPQTHFLYAVFTPEAVPPEAFEAPCWQRPWSSFSRAGVLLHPLRGLLDELVVSEPLQAAVCRGYIEVLCLRLARLCTVAATPAPAPLRHPAAERAQRLLREHLDQPWRIETLARLSGASVPHLIEVYRRDWGTTPMRALQRFRLEAAYQRLRETQAPVTRIAHELGFASSQHFARAFKAAYGQTPSALRAARSR